MKKKKKYTSQITALSFLGSWWALGCHFSRREVIEWVVVRPQIWPLGNGTGDPARELHYAVEGTDTNNRWLFLRLQDTVLPFLGATWMNFTHTLSCLNCTRNLSHTETSLHIMQEDHDLRSVDWDSTLLLV